MLKLVGDCVKLSDIIDPIEKKNLNKIIGFALNLHNFEVPIFCYHCFYIILLTGQ